MKRLINITHTDTDGIGCGVICGLFARRYDMELEVHYCGYGQVTDAVKAVIDEVSDHPDDHNIAMLIISDISVKEDTNVHVLLNRMVEAHPEITVRLLDHHGTADWLNKFNWAEVHEYDNAGVKRCGTYWVYKFLSEFFSDYKTQHTKELNDWVNSSRFNDDGPQPLDIDPVVDYVLAVDLYDTWKWVEDYPEGQPYNLAVDLDRLLKIKGAAEMHKAMIDRLDWVGHIHLMQMGKWTDPRPTFRTLHGYQSTLITDTDEQMLYFKELEIQRAIEQKKQQLTLGTYEFTVDGGKQFSVIKQHFIKKYAKSRSKMLQALNEWKPGTTHSFDVGVVWCGDYMSEIGNALAKEHPELDFIILVMMPGNISLRCTKDLPVPLSVIAHSIGRGQGGGHEKSAGCPVKFHVSRGLAEDLVRGLNLQR